MEDLLNQILARANQIPNRNYGAEELLEDIQELVIAAIGVYKSQKSDDNPGMR